jgi:hypothetical protein
MTDRTIDAVRESLVGTSWQSLKTARFVVIARDLGNGHYLIRYSSGISRSITRSELDADFRRSDAPAASTGTRIRRRSTGVHAWIVGYAGTFVTLWVEPGATRQIQIASLKGQYERDPDPSGNLPPGLAQAIASFEAPPAVSEQGFLSVRDLSVAQRWASVASGKYFWVVQYDGSFAELWDGVSPASELRRVSRRTISTCWRHCPLSPHESPPAGLADVIASRQPDGVAHMTSQQLAVPFSCDVPSGTAATSPDAPCDITASPGVPLFADIPRVRDCLRTSLPWADVPSFLLGVAYSSEFRWSDTERTRYCEYVLRDGSGSLDIYLCETSAHHVVVADGIERLEAVAAFCNDEIPVFGLLCSEYGDSPRVAFSVHRRPDTMTETEIEQWRSALNYPRYSSPRRRRSKRGTHVET